MFYQMSAIITFAITSVKNTVQAFKYPSADAVTLYMLGYKAIN